MPIQPDQLLLYDTAVRQWMIDTFGTCVALPKEVHFTVGTPDRAFAEYVTPTGLAPDGRPPVPRVALTVGDWEIDDERHNPNVIRKLGYSDANKTHIRRAYYPVPVNIHYTLNFWTEYAREMNQFVMAVMQQFKSQVTYITVDIDSISPIAGLYGSKAIGLYKEGSVSDTGNLEPGGEERIFRKTFPFFMKAWLWDFSVLNTGIVKEFAVEFYRDEDFSLLLEVASTPQRDHDLFTGDGATLTFSGNTFRTPIIPRTFLLDATVGGQPVRVRDDGSGILLTLDDEAEGTINYDTGAVSVEFAAAPDDNTEISAAYFNTL